MTRLDRGFRVALRDRNAAALQALVRRHRDAHAGCARRMPPIYPIDPENGYRNTALDSARSHPEIAAYLSAAGAKHASELDDR